MRRATEAGRRVWAGLTRRRGSPLTTRLVRLTGLTAFAGLALGVSLPAAMPLIALVLLTVWTNGPWSPVMVTAYEPILLLYGTLYAPVLVAVVATIGSVLVEIVNYHVYVAVTDLAALRRLRDRPLVQRVSAAYRRAPFLTVVVCALTPIPFWIARGLSAFTRYSALRHVVATGIGRFPRLWFFASLGAALRIPAAWLLAVTAAALLAGALVVLVRRRRTRPAAPVPPTPVDLDLGGVPCGCSSPSS